jgi:predicted transcriptional regulator
MARLEEGEKSEKEDKVERVLYEHDFGLCEVEIAEELGWERRTVNNYLHALERQGRIYKEGRSWFTED